MDPVTLLTAGSKILGSLGQAAASSPAGPANSAVGSYTSGFDSSGFVVNFGSGKVENKAGGAKNSSEMPIGIQSGASNWQLWALVGVGLLATYYVLGK